MTDLKALIGSITPLDFNYVEQARARQAQLTKPAGSLGRLEEIAAQVAGITRSVIPVVQRRAVVVMAADHGVTAEGVSAYPKDVTPQMVLNFLAGGAAINALARQAHADVIVVDIGVAADLEHPNLLSRKVRRGTANMAREAAMSEVEVLQAINIGIAVLENLAEQGLDLVATGEMGIGNTTAASALSACLLDVPAEYVTGRGTGIDDQQLAHKVRIIERAIAHNAPDISQPLDVLAKLGGLEIAGLVGVILAAASRRIPIIIDGFISSAAALVAWSLAPTVRDYLFAGHLSVERGHRLILEKLDLEPLLNLNLRLGEGTGAVLAMHIIEGALRTHKEMATFSEASVSNKDNA
ncbi:nicotinate-nucleotide--dimethylbenzimidazole phosphoribosyltransferase [Dictyobacter aurantiacus]|uniref:Nicotinate-nucleotide--dimethylbenzimidazole phosphoribosyltransferase n=1 Tax=Dictyobacter aurantiacus TaxID=1936993 RepID=A0A401Z8Z4_9CHLR|nr:nicotinate-nucleotide--dimethylbenzimidazole phosphoribosyltransferase [Dictyobacter aurantiacus]GCE03334.1 nicotinate-nucleotide--dimethylbenzimidazole phosphoribosyltransferase [Dictyobacter aurantiacus]